MYNAPVFSLPPQEAIAVGIELETSRLGSPDSYFKQLPQMLEKKRDEVIAVLKEVGFEPIVPDGGYFVMADTSPVGESCLSNFNISSVRFA